MQVGTDCLKPIAILQQEVALCNKELINLGYSIRTTIRVHINNVEINPANLDQSFNMFTLSTRYPILNRDKYLRRRVLEILLLTSNQNAENRNNFLEEEIHPNVINFIENSIRARNELMINHLNPNIQRANERQIWEQEETRRDQSTDQVD